jgi:hypothetical protein
MREDDIRVPLFIRFSSRPLNPPKGDFTPPLNICILVKPPFGGGWGA